jgi:hypothetical protein
MISSPSNSQTRTVGKDFITTSRLDFTMSSVKDELEVKRIVRVLYSYVYACICSLTHMMRPRERDGGKRRLTGGWETVHSHCAPHCGSAEPPMRSVVVQLSRHQNKGQASCSSNPESASHHRLILRSLEGSHSRLCLSPPARGRFTGDISLRFFSLYFNSWITKYLGTADATKEASVESAP